MNQDALRKLIEDLYRQKLKPQEAYQKLKNLPYEDLGFARVDHHRSLRNGMPEVIYCEGKTPAQVATLIRKIDRAGSDVLATRMDLEIYKKIKSKISAKAKYNPDARTLVIQKNSRRKKIGRILVLSAGTADIPVAEEAAITAELLGSRVDKIYDVGVAGIHRLLDQWDRLREARVIVAVAGMEGALVSVVGGLVDCPIVAVPTNVGYGAVFDGLAPLLTMLNTCAPGVGVVNIENGFGAGCLAHRINRLGEPEAS
ncbi:MAG: nickel pincer cofactor biosynthesis protein LarB [Nitrospinaceae bacterium]|nr:nickel pincer cofactor biosynthesis protein LarB [Nitrospinaceae bacterium]NIR55924.1 nickel pincer cofactor biosynthesis protein LarB [Nitrospinaceae bacterium]NIS86371.1 nickel pincer cofactor biosynthesis protein LarB [Nitrospinaceae bacterium]NIT83204.1 nickel pincer cofactor biosynthesis protein LarB [Nitrospinaceae bacterium]NIU45418.1 nickel pincer cofactor biosynthesis protein LarB [Nitrospinaceae bacterium]